MLIKCYGLFTGNTLNEHIMNKILILLALTFSFTLSAQGDGECEELFEAYSYYEDGTIKFVGTADCQDRPHGAFVEYRNDGVTLLGTGEFKHGVRVGVWITHSIHDDSSYIIYYDDEGNRIKAEKVIGDLVIDSKKY